MFHKKSYSSNLKTVIMKRTVISVLTMVVLLLMANIAFSQSGADYKAKIEALNKEMTKNMLAGDREKLLGLYTDDAVSMPSYHPMEDGIAAIRKASDEMAQSGVKYTSFLPVTLKVIPSGNLITEIGTYKVTLTVPNTDKPIEDHGKYVTIWEKQKDGSLKVKVETWNSDVDPMSMMNSQTGQNAADKK
jgi:ketosteroid isomerase-like protein